MKKVIFTFVLFFTCTWAFSQGSTTINIYIGDSKVACQYNNTITSCLKIKSHLDSNWREFPYEIEGFIFEPGVEVHIEMGKTPILFPEDNGPKFTYKQIRVIDTRSTVLENKALLAANKWKIINLEMDRVVTPAKKAGAYVLFNTDSNTVSGFAGCNSFFANTLIENGVLQFGVAQNTLLACSNDAIEQRIMEGLKGKAAYYVRNNMLFIVCENRMIMHCRPEKKLDSLIADINKPAVVSRGNTFGDMQNGEYVVTLDDLPKAVNMQMFFKSTVLTAAEKKTIKIKLKNNNADEIVSQIIILSKPHKMKGYYYATVMMKDGTKTNVVMRNVL